MEQNPAMRKIILQVAVSLDGFIEGPKGEYDWCFTDQDYGFSAFMQRVDTTFMGRKSYEMMLKVAEQQPEFALPKIKEYVFSTTLDEVKEGAILIKSDVKKQVLEIKQQKGKDIWLFGGAGLTTSLLNLGLVDEVVLAVHPILLGGGKPLFRELNDRMHLTLIDSQSYSTGLILLTYQLI